MPLSTKGGLLKLKFGNPAELMPGQPQPQQQKKLLKTERNEGT